MYIMYINIYIYNVGCRHDCKQLYLQPAAILFIYRPSLYFYFCTIINGLEATVDELNVFLFLCP